MILPASFYARKMVKRETCWASNGKARTKIDAVESEAELEMSQSSASSGVNQQNEVHPKSTMIMGHDHDGAP